MRTDRTPRPPRSTVSQHPAPEVRRHHTRQPTSLDPIVDRSASAEFAWAERALDHTTERAAGVANNVIDDTRGRAALAFSGPWHDRRWHRRLDPVPRVRRRRGVGRDRRGDRAVHTPPCGRPVDRRECAGRHRRDRRCPRLIRRVAGLAGAGRGRSVVLQGDGVGSDVHLRFVLRHLDDPTLGRELGPEISVTGRARTVEVLGHRCLTTRAVELHEGRRYNAYDRR